MEELASVVGNECPQGFSSLRPAKVGKNILVGCKTCAPNIDMFSIHDLESGNRNLGSGLAYGFRTHQAAHDQQCDQRALPADHVVCCSSCSMSCSILWILSGVLPMYFL